MSISKGSGRKLYITKIGRVQLEWRRKHGLTFFDSIRNRILTLLDKRGSEGATDRALFNEARKAMRKTRATPWGTGFSTPWAGNEDVIEAQDIRDGIAMLIKEKRIASAQRLPIINRQYEEKQLKKKLRMKKITPKMPCLSSKPPRITPKTPRIS